MPDKEVAVNDLIRKVELLVNNFTNSDVNEERVVRAAIEAHGLDELGYAGLSLAECHVIDCIGRTEPINTTAIAKQMDMTKGGISKITAKLVDKNMIEVRRLKNNRKETYFTLTPPGREVFRLHAELHKQATARLGARFAAYSGEELRVVVRFVDDLLSEFRAAHGGEEEG